MHGWIILHFLPLSHIARHYWLLQWLHYPTGDRFGINLISFCNGSMY